ncbi:MAG: bifunctional transaldolase/phosoglucose isomerase [Ardenticatenaceae bacterium]|nr:bifunctional transaldolase/phosoglucose isomerase [Ardenticatenaceae bacterium]
MEENPLLKLQTFGQSIWLDTIRRGMLVTGELAQLIEEDGLRGVTVNPSILEKAISGSHDYDQTVRVLALDNKKEADIYEALGVEDVQRAADLFRPMYERTEGQHGFVSLEVAPALAHDTAGTIAEARRFWAELDRPNVMIKVPATREGLPAIQQLTAEGINVNVTLLFGLPRYREVAEAYLTGLEARGAQGKPLDRVASVASFFLSRIDVLVDPKLEKVIQTGGRKGEIAASLHGQVAIASARVAYQIYQELFAGERFRGLAARGARAQRLLWASTSTKNPAYSDVKYVEALIGLDTVNTLPLETLNAYRDHGNPAPRLEEGLPAAQRVLQRLPEVGIDLNAVTQQLEDEGVHKFAVSYDRLMDTLKVKRAAALKEPLDRQVLDLNGDTAAVQERIASLEEEHLSDRLWHKDPSLWKTGPADQEVIRNALGWLHVAEKMEESLSYLSDFVADVRAAGVRHVVHMGMGGSSLAPLVFERTFEPGGNGLPLTVLDTTDPTTILEIERAVPLADTLFLVASKSGTTAEPLAFGDYFYARVKALKGDRAGENFVAITDPNTPLVKLAQERGFRQTFLNFPDIGGRYSALSYFGLVPAALLGVDVSEVLLRVLRMVHACASCVPVRENPGGVLGAVLGELVRRGRDKVTFLMPEAIATLGMWLEQLLAESTGKEGTGLLPVAGEPLGAPSAYGSDRLFVYVRLAGEVDQALERGVAALREAGQPVVTVRMDDRLDVGQEFFRWEIATATAGAILGINAFDQPNVQESKNNTNRLLTVVRAQGQLPEEQPSLVEDSVRLYAPETARSASETVAQFLAQARPGDYVALLAYLTENAATEHALEAIRLHLRDRLHLATTLGYGPRYLHSTGQFHKGGPNTGLFLLLTADDAEEAPIPGQPYTFGVLKHAQALGDLEALRKHGRRAVRVDLGSEVGTGLAALQRILATALDRG